MNRQIKIIEDLSLNAWPSHQMELYDGWILRFSYFYTHRTNSVEQIGPSTVPLKEKIDYCEAVYRDWGTPCIFKINPLVPRDFDTLLYKKEYSLEHVTEVMTLNMQESALINKARYPEENAVRNSSRDNLPAAAGPVILENHISSKWILSLFDLKHTTNEIHRRIVPSMYQAIPKKTIAAHIEDEHGRFVAMGLGILDRDYIGVYAIHVDRAYRRRHYARAICQSILEEGMRLGATKAYLQVVQGNTAAKKLYQSLGFNQLYTYWFRVSP